MKITITLTNPPTIIIDEATIAGAEKILLPVQQHSNEIKRAPERSGDFTVSEFFSTLRDMLNQNHFDNDFADCFRLEQIEPRHVTVFASNAVPQQVLMFLDLCGKPSAHAISMRDLHAQLRQSRQWRDAARLKRFTNTVIHPFFCLAIEEGHSLAIALKDAAARHAKLQPRKPAKRKS